MKSKLFHTWIISLSLAGIAIFAVAPVQARGPGSGRGMGSGAPAGFSGGQSASVPSSAPRRAWANSGFDHSSGAPWNDANGRFAVPTDNRGVTQQQINEARIVEHRLDQAERLRTISERNGNSNLLDTANRMESQANQHYDQRTQQIDNLTALHAQNPMQPLADNRPRLGVSTSPVARQAKAPKTRRWWQWPFRR